MNLEGAERVHGVVGRVEGVLGSRVGSVERVLSLRQVTAKQKRIHTAFVALLMMAEASIWDMELT